MGAARKGTDDMRRLNAQDDRWLAIDTPENPYQIAALLLLEAHDERPPADFESTVRSHLERRLPSTPLLVRHCPAPFGFDTGVWCDLDRCDLDACVVRVETDRALTRGDLSSFVARQVMQRWEPNALPFRVFVFDRLDASLGEGRVALMLQTHHALADGVGFQSIVRALTDAERDPKEPPAAPRETVAGGSDLAALSRGRSPRVCRPRPSGDRAWPAFRRR